MFVFQKMRRDEFRSSPNDAFPILPYYTLFSIVARNIHRKTSHMEAARDFYKFALELNSSSTSKNKSFVPDKKLKSLPPTVLEPKLSSPTKQLKRDGRGRFISTSSPDMNPNKSDNAGKHHTLSPTAFLAAHDDYCKVCEYGGELICCATCNLVFHLECLRPKLMKLPPGKLHRLLPLSGRITISLHIV